MRQPAGTVQGVASDPWKVAWLIAVPVIVILVYAKAARVLAAMVWSNAAPIDDSSLRGILSWLWMFTSLRLAGALLIAFALQRFFFPRRPLLAIPLGALLFALLVVFAAVVKRDDPLSILVHWLSQAWEQYMLMVACLWRDAIIVAWSVLILGACLWLAPPRIRPWLVRGMQVLALGTALLVAIDYVQELATGQQTNMRVLLFGLANAGDVAVIVKEEASFYRVALLALVLLFSLAWTWRTWSLARRPVARTMKLSPALGGATVGAAAFFFPVPPIEANQRDMASTLLTLVRTLRPVEDDQIRAEVFDGYARTARARWDSSALALRQTSTTKRRNVVIVMIESMRAQSTTVHSSHLPTTPFLKALAAKGVMVENMYAVIPRTAAAWIAILGGLYPLTNEGTAIWAGEYGGSAPALTGLAGALRNVGYSTAYFSPAHLGLLNDRQLIEALGFETVLAGDDVNLARAPKVNYFGAADEVMVQPILDWSAKQAMQGHPFFAAIMTNVGHHPYMVPPNWPRTDFGAEANPALENYYNCMRYVDSVLSSLVQGYEKLGLLQETVFVFIGDHGQMFGEHNLKQSFNALYEQGLHVPAVLYAPGLLEEGQVIGGLRQQIDVFPTIVELLGMQIDGARLPGTSLFKPVDPQRPLYFSSSIDRTQLGMMRGSKKYVYSFGREPIRTFDLASDSAEAKPLAGVDAQELAEARKAMIEWRAHADVSMYGRPTRKYKPLRSWVGGAEAQ